MKVILKQGPGNFFVWALMSVIASVLWIIIDYNIKVNYAKNVPLT